VKKNAAKFLVLSYLLWKEHICAYSLLAPHGCYKAKFMILRTVTLQEANGLLPLVREHFFRIHVMLAKLQHVRKQLSAKESAGFMIDRGKATIVIIKRKPVIKNLKAAKRAAKDFLANIEEEIQELMKLGVVIKGLVPPHIDFLSVRNNEPILLCWHGGEREIEHWHYLDDGAPTRQVIPHKNRIGPHMVH
jgi:hypothetical protein